MASPVESAKTSNGVFKRLPRLSNSVWLLIIVALVLVVSVPPFMSYIDEQSKQAPLRERLVTLQGQYAALQKQIASQGSLSTEIARLKSDIEVARGAYGDSCDTIEASNSLINLAWQNDITILTMSASSSSAKIQGKDYPGTSYVLSVTGQTPSFQNYMRAVGEKFVSSQTVDIMIQPATAEGMLDHATLTIRMVCGQ
jgi:hypothetical protein